MIKFLGALIAISLGGAVIVSLVVGTVRRFQSDRIQRTFLQLAQELRLQVDFSAQWGSRPLPIASGNLEGAYVRIESRLYRAKVPWYVRTHVEATRRDKQGPVGTIGQPARMRAPEGSVSSTVQDASGRQLTLQTTFDQLLLAALDEELIRDLIDVCRPGMGVVLHPDRVEYTDAPVADDAGRVRVERAARATTRLAKRLASPSV